MARPTYDPQSLLVGVIGKPHGLAGEMTLRAYNLRGADLAKVPELIFERGQARDTRRLRSARRRADGWLVRVEGVDTRDHAAALTHTPVRVRKEALPALGPGEFFVEDLLGCEVRTVDGDVLGVVDTIFWNGAHDVMSVQQIAQHGNADGDISVPAKGKTAVIEHLIPLVPDFLHTVDAAARQVVVAWERDEGEAEPSASSGRAPEDRT
jgi:16S rRNA processing protein RimM